MNASNATLNAGPTALSIDPREAALFGGLAEDWWNPKGSSRMLHAVNPLRLGFIRERACAHFARDGAARVPFAGLRALDIGCGGGLLTEPLTRLGFAVTGLDAAPENVAIARAHAERQGLAIGYRAQSAEALAAEGQRFDLVTCMEVVEHVADLDSFLAALRMLLSDSGLLIFSTPNRTLASYAVLIVGAERVTGLIPKGAHDWGKFVRPDELTEALARHGMAAGELRGLSWRPGRGFALTGDLGIDYFGSATCS